MCELLGMSANTPTDLCFSFTGLTRRGGETGPHKDGWGVAFYEGKGVRMFHDPEPSATSPIADFVSTLPIKSKTAICHIRQANVGNITLANTHPFARELWGEYWVFAHNGQIPSFSAAKGMYEPVGDTDSEAMFCDIMNHVRQHLPRDTSPLELVESLVSLSQAYAKQGVFNCLLGNGDWLFTFCSTKLASITRRAPFGPACLKDVEVAIDFAAETTPKDVVSIIATEPLTNDEQWDVYERGEWKLWQDGEVIAAGKVDVPEHKTESKMVSPDPDIERKPSTDENQG
ncbi:class II glutamine amidotransferase [Alteromonas genovensis]|uniref:Class II glutamine amidotransferase n=1 Tax=Alteromonas genovensis TaxID=471225 RepID=A0A6N9THG2_9ALTE|nr:class II glutamine amidotransferase [Alteromonas sp.]MAI36989.1 class II glutamine amidotransferase [Alteromonas sp.]NDW16753.1 class II glutamine amidotransferase [Alteromonas genovensis]OUX89809.1 MAG: class II glutamine amidotransferase [Alteromonas sp. TMED35]